MANASLKHRERARFLRQSSGTFKPDGQDREVDYDNYVFEIFGGRVKVPASGENRVPIPQLVEGAEYELVYDGLDFRPNGNYLIPQLRLSEVVSMNGNGSGS